MLLPQRKLDIVAVVFLAVGAMTLQAQQPAYQQPPSPPQVSYKGGQLSVIANNSTFADVLRAVQNVLGAQIEGVSPWSTERIFGQFGPASPGTVLDAVFAGSPYDFIIVDSGPEDHGRILHIILRARSNAPSHSSQTAASSALANNSNYSSGVTDQFSRIDPQWSVPQYVAPGTTQQQNNGQPAPYRQRHRGAAYWRTNSPPYNPNAMNPNQQPQ